MRLFTIASLRGNETCAFVHAREKRICHSCLPEDMVGVPQGACGRSREHTVSRRKGYRRSRQG
jgi:hypothetical protein